MDLMKDHGHKAYLACETQFNNPDIFNKVENQLSYRFKASLITSFVVPLLLLLLTFLNIFSSSASSMIFIVTLLSPLLLAYEIFIPSSIREKITGLFLWPCMGATICIGVLLANIKMRGKAIFQKLSYVPV